MMFLLYGGSASGKSQVAEDVAVALGGKVAYIATMRVYGAEGRARVARHRALRAGKGFATVECPCNLAQLDLAAALAGQPGFEEPGRCTVLLECLGNLVANQMFAEDGSCLDEDRVFAQVRRGLDSLAASCEHLVLVGNDVGASGIRYTPETQAYVRCLGRLCCGFAAQADCVAEVLCGIPVVVKGGQAWPL